MHCAEVVHNGERELGIFYFQDPLSTGILLLALQPFTEEGKSFFDKGDIFRFSQEDTLRQKIFSRKHSQTKDCFAKRHSQTTASIRSHT